MDKRLFLLSPVLFQEEILPLIEEDYIRKGRPPKINHSHVFSGILGRRFRGMIFLHWHAVYLRFKPKSEKREWWRILYKLQRQKKIKLKVI